MAARAQHIPIPFASSASPTSITTNTIKPPANALILASSTTAATGGYINNDKNSANGGVVAAPSQNELTGSPSTPGAAFNDQTSYNNATVGKSRRSSGGKLLNPGGGGSSKSSAASNNDSKVWGYLFGSNNATDHSPPVEDESLLSALRDLFKSIFNQKKKTGTVNPFPFVTKLKKENGK